MPRPQPGDQVWVAQDPYDDIPQAGYATVTNLTGTDGMVWVQFDPILVSVDRVHPRPTRGGR